MSVMDNAIYLKKNRLQRVTITATSDAEPLRDELKGPGWVRVQAIGADVQCYFGEAADTVTLNETANADEMGYTVINGHYADFYLPGAQHHDHFVWASGGSGFVELLKTDQKVKTAPSFP